MMMSTVRGVICFAAITSTSLSVSPQGSNSISAAAVKTHVFKLADDKWEGRGAGYRGEKAAADYIATQFRNAGLRPAGTKGYFQEFRFHPYHPTSAWEVMASRNIIGSVDGSDPVLKNEIVLIGAHYDGQGRLGQANPTRQTAPGVSPSDEIWNSANDNASSIAALIEIARLLKKAPPKRTVVFAAFGAEEHGMTGSIYYVNNPVHPISSHVAMINLEKLGRSPERPLVIAGLMSSKVWPLVIETASKTVPTKIATNPIAFPDSDHYPFGARGVPAIIVAVSSAADAHLPSDTADKIDFERTASAAQFAASLLQDIANRSERPDFVRSPMLDPGMIAHLATGAEVDAAGVETGKGGLKVTGIIFDRPAAKAGLREGDLILSIGGRPFAREEPLSVLMGIYQELLQGKLGVSLPMKVLRNKQTMEMTLDLRP